MSTIPSLMKAFQFVNLRNGLQLRDDLPVPNPGHGEALIRVKAAGLCHSDTHVLRGGGAAWMCALPVILGHEIAGTIAKLGPGSSNSELRLNDRVAVACVGHPVHERDFKEACGVGRDGGYAEYVVAPIKNIVKLPDNVGFPQAAVATDSIATAYHAVMTEGAVQQSSTVAILGLGGLGLNGVAIAALQGARVYGVDINPAKFDQALNLGASRCATSLDRFKDVVFDVIIDFAGVQATFDGAMSQIRNGGTVVLVGLGASHLTLSTTDLVTKNVSVRGSTSASKLELCEVLRLLESGALEPVITAIEFKAVPDSLASLDRNEITGRLYTIP